VGSQQDRQHPQQSHPNTSNTSAAAATSKSDPVPALDRGRGNTAHVRRLRGDGAFPLWAPAFRGLRTTTTDQSDADDQTGHSQHHHPQARRSAWPASCLPCLLLLLLLPLLSLLRPAPRVSGGPRDTAVQPNTCQSVSRPLQHALARHSPYSPRNPSAQFPWPWAGYVLAPAHAHSVASRAPLSLCALQVPTYIPTCLPAYLPTYRPTDLLPPTSRCLSNTASLIKLKFHPSPRPRHHQPTLPRLHVANPDDLPPKYTPIPHYLFSRPSQA
jgi:hypothetical protein